MPLSLRKLGVATHLLFKGEFRELLRRIRVSVFGCKAIAPPDFFGPSTPPGLVTTEPTEPDQGSVAKKLNRVPTDPIRSLMFGHNLNLEGAPISQFELTRALMERGVIAPEVIAFSDGPLRINYEDAGIPVTVVPPCLGRIPTVGRLAGVVEELTTLIQEKQPGVIYANTLMTFVPILAAHEVGVPSIWNPRESEPWETCFGFLNETVAQRALAAIALPYQVIFVADATRRIWSRFDVRGNFAVIRNGLDPRTLPSNAATKTREATRKRLGYRDGDVVFLCVGTVCQRKGQRDLVQAFGMLKNAFAAASRLCLVGDAEMGYRNLLRSDIDRLPPERRNRVAMYQATPEINEFFASADAFVLCSRAESYPRVILEAMAHGLPVIATPIFGVREQLTEGVNVIFFEPGDVQTLSSRMSLLIEDRNMRNRLGRDARIGLDALTSFDEMIEAYSAAFRGAFVGGTRRQSAH